MGKHQSAVAISSVKGFRQKNAYRLRRFSRQNLQQMRAFFVTWPICQTLSGKLSLSQLAQVFVLPWSAYVRLLSVQDAHARQFYETEAL